MARAWIFQANPDRFDIDGALAVLDRIRWRVPQHAGAVRVGDSGLVWRSGREAGIVAVASVETPPQETSPHPDELPFDRSEVSDVTTHVTLRVMPCAFVPKAVVASLPQLADHQIITAPMGTVFPLDEKQWSAVRDHVPEPPPIQTSALPSWPAPLSWQQRVSVVSVIMADDAAYQQVLAEILGYVDATQPARQEFVDWLTPRYGGSRNRAASVANFLAKMGLLYLDAARVGLSPEGARWLQERDAAFLLALFHARLRYVGELLAALDRPRSLEELRQYANDAYALNWRRRGQITRRRQFLAGLGAVEVDESGRLVRTPFGEAVLGRLTLAPAQTHTASVEAPPPTTPPAPVRASDRESGEAPLKGGSAVDLIEHLRSTAHDSANPAAFERAARDAFAFLGFDAVWHGGAGRTDVLLTAPLGSRDQYRVVVDTKSTAGEAVSDQQIDWVTIDEHKTLYEADHACIVAPAFRGARLAERARANRAVALLDVTTLSELLQQHEVAPLDLAAYRVLFEPALGADEVFERGEVLRRELLLAAEIVRQVTDLEGNEGIVTPGDLYWNLDAFADQFAGQRAERQEIEEFAAALARSPLALLRAVDGGFTSLGARAIQYRRLRLLAELIETGRPETVTE
ncbi:EVE domain-containing protein [Egicoccus sp. AB-alg2]|uniref:EVE domain-containing protein n=1 Tax=Egicoccus sp. AB-alg2 TaxID=3242693 RepID=UPI00359EE18A